MVASGKGHSPVEGEEGERGEGWRMEESPPAPPEDPLTLLVVEEEWEGLVEVDEENLEEGLYVGGKDLQERKKKWGRDRNTPPITC
jgi:hypothetical protein